MADGITTDEINTNTTSTETTTTTDNSSNAEFTQDEISKALEEPVSVENEGKTEPTDAQEPPKQETKDNSKKVDCPDKFKNEDGSVNLENLLKSYKELEPLIQDKANWTKERAELLQAKEELNKLNDLQAQTAKNAGYDTIQDMQQVYDIAYIEANEYAKYLQYTDDPEEVRQMLISYMNNPSAELMESIELEFAPEINKRVAIVSDRRRQTYEAEKEKAVETAKMTAIENTISQAVDTNKEIFEYAPFKQLFLNALQTYGEKFTIEDAKVLMNTMMEMKELFKAEFEKQSGIKLANEQATDKIAAINTQNNNSAPGARQLTNDDISKMSDSELAKEIRKLL